jgi:hypothetical protein
MTQSGHDLPPSHTAQGLHSPTGAVIFTPTEIEVFRRDDRSAAASIVGLMAGIFTIGLIGYLCVAWWVGG